MIEQGWRIWDRLAPWVHLTLNLEAALNHRFLCYT
jgi:hypothetical protein